MSDDANRLIDNLFQRINEAEKQTGERDKEAEAHINKHLVSNPSAPYYMAQTIIMQEAALKQLKAKVETLEKEAANKPSSGGFLSGLFGGGDSHNTSSGAQANANSQPNGGWGRNQSSWGGNNQQGYGQQANNPGGYGAQRGGFGGGGSGFLGGALKTAAGVAGGVVVGNMLMDMFSHHSQTEMVDIINEQPANPDMGQDGMADNGMNDSGFDQGGMDQGGMDGMDQGGGFGQAGFDQGGMDQNGFNPDAGGFDQTDFNQGGFDQGGFGDFGGGFDDFGSNDDFI